MRIFITGNRGQLGGVLTVRLADAGHDAAGGDLPDWDMLNPDEVLDSLRAFQPDIVVHTAALTAVDYCAEHPEEAVRVNGVGTHHVALACRELGAMLAAISTNEVFDGRADRPYQEYDARNPINPYGYSKAVAEQVVERFAQRYMIVRTSWLFAPGGSNFIHKIITGARESQPLRVVTDEIGSPTYVFDLVEGLCQLIEIGRPGIYHLTNAGHCSRYEFAQEIVRLAGLDAPIQPITLTDFSRPSTPPPYAPLANIFAATAGIHLRSWQDALAEYITQHETPTA